MNFNKSTVILICFDYYISDFVKKKGVEISTPFLSKIQMLF